VVAFAVDIPALAVGILEEAVVDRADKAEAFHILVVASVADVFGCMPCSEDRSVPFRKHDT